MGIAQAIVVDATKRNPFGIIGYHILKPLSGPAAGIWKTKKVPVESMSVDNDMKFDRSELEQTLRGSLKIDQRPAQPYHNPMHPPVHNLELPSPADATYPDNVLRQAHQFMSAAQSYVSRFNSRERKHPSYLASLINSLPHNPMASTVRRLGELEPEKSNGNIITLNYNAAIPHSCMLLTRECPERTLLTRFGSVVSLKTQNHHLEAYVKSVLD